jgi:leader peptidase (prepilin peptidase) / N-methyltransferase
VIAPPVRRFDRATLVLCAAGLACVVASLSVSPDANGMLGATLAALMLAIAAVDARKFIIPDPLVLAALALGLLRA